MKTNMNAIYSILCRDCSECYICETIDFTRRLYQHKYDLQTGNVHCALYQYRGEKILTTDAKVI